MYQNRTIIISSRVCPNSGAQNYALSSIKKKEKETSNQRMNDYLKELAELAGIDEPIRETYYIGNKRIDEVTPKYALLSTHAGRRTFICNALALGIPANVVMKWTVVIATIKR